MPITRDAAGRLIFPGTIARTQEESFLGTALPAWLQTTQGTGVFLDKATSDGRYRASTDAASGAVANLLTTDTVNSAGSAAFLLEYEGLSFSAQTVQAEMYMRGSNAAGLTLRQNNGVDATAVIIANGQTTPIDYQFIGTAESGGIAAARRNIGLLFIPSTKEVYVLENREPIAYVKLASVNGGGLIMGAAVTSRSSGASNLAVGKVRRTLFQ